MKLWIWWFFDLVSWKWKSNSNGSGYFDRVLLGGGWSFLGCQSKSQMIRDFYFLVFILSAIKQGCLSSFPLPSGTYMVRLLYASLSSKLIWVLMWNLDISFCQLWLVSVDLMIVCLTHRCSNHTIKYVIMLCYHEGKGWGLPLVLIKFDLMSFNSKFLVKLIFSMVDLLNGTHHIIGFQCLFIFPNIYMG